MSFVFPLVGELLAGDAVQLLRDEVLENLVGLGSGSLQDSYDAIVAAAAEFNMSVMGHIPSNVGLEHALRSKQRTFEHLFGYEVALQYDDEPILPQASFNERFEAWTTLDFEKLPGLAEATRSAGVWNCPTLIVLQKRLTDEQVARLALDCGAVCLRPR